MQTLTFYIISLKFLSIIRAPEIVSALIGAASALLVFYLTILNDKRKEKKKQKEIYEYRMQYLATLVKSSIIYTENTIKNIDELCNKINKDDITFHLITYNPSNSFNRIQELIKNEGYFSAYVSTFGKDKSDEYNKLAETVDYFVADINIMYVHNKDVQENDWKRKRKFYDLFDNIQPNLNHIMNKYISDIDVIDKINKELNKIKKHKEPKDIRTNNSNVLDLHVEFVKLLQNQNLVYFHEIFIDNFLDKLNDIVCIYDEIKLLNKTHKDDMGQIKQRLEEALNGYKETTKNLITKSISKP